MLSFCPVVQASSKRCNFLKDESVPRIRDFEQTVSSTVLEQARRGDCHAFRRIVGLYAGLVYHWCRKSGLSPEDAEDVGQQVFMTVSKNLQSFRRVRPVDSFRAWIRVITRSRIADHFRWKQCRPNEYCSEKQIAVARVNDEDGLECLHEDTIVLYDQAVKLMQSEFSEQDCTAFLLLVVEGMPPSDVGKQLGVSANSVYIAKSRILKRLRAEFDGLLDG